MKYILWIICLVQIQVTIAQTTYTVRTGYPNGKVKSISTLKYGRVIAEEYYLENGTLKHSWNIEKKIVHSYSSFGNPDDSSANYFEKHCPTYTIYQHFANSPTLFYIERYKNGIRHGKAQYYYENGRLEAEGEFDHWKKVGFWSYRTPQGRKDIHWHGLEHGFDQKGLSIFHTVLPVCFTLLILVVAGVFSIRQKAYPTFSIVVISLPFAVLACWVLILWRMSESRALAFKINYVKDFIPILNTTTIAMLLICLINSIWANRLGVKRSIHIIGLIVGLFFGLLVAMLQAMANLAGAVGM